MESLTQTAILPMQDASQIPVVRRVAAGYATAAQMDPQRVGALNVVLAELSNNLLQHAGGGSLYIGYLARLGALDIAAVDHGRGMVSVERCLEDGYSTASTPGLGLGAVRRFAMSFGAYSIPDRTTVIAARMAETKAGPDFSVVSTAMEGETLSGDSWTVSDDGASFLVVDGLGHGMFAADAAKAAVEIFHTYPQMEPVAVLEKMHAGMRATRGAAAAIVTVRPESRRLDFAGLGNISCAVMTALETTAEMQMQSLVSHNGTLGHQMRRTQQFSYSYGRGDLLIMQSDGLSTQLKKGFPSSLFQQPPTVIAPLVYAEQLRGRDDATILVNRLA